MGNKRKWIDVEHDLPKEGVTVEIKDEDLWKSIGHYSDGLWYDHNAKVHPDFPSDAIVFITDWRPID